jgi:hypothetical protein
MRKADKKEKRSALFVFKTRQKARDVERKKTLRDSRFVAPTPHL